MRMCGESGVDNSADVPRPLPLRVVPIHRYHGMSGYDVVDF